MNNKKKFTFETDIENLVPEYVEARKQECKQMILDFQVGHYPAIEIVAIKLKGNAGSFGFEELGNLAAQLEISCREKNHRLINELLKKIKDYIDQIQISN